MIELCRINNLIVTRKTDFGVYLGLPQDGYSCDSEGGKLNSGCVSGKEVSKQGSSSNVLKEVLLPRKEVPEGTNTGDVLKVFVYTDSEDRPVATVKKPYIVMGEIQVLKVKQITSIGAFLDWGLDKDLLLPFKEQTEPVSFDPVTGKTTGLCENDRVPVILYVDKSGRPAATMRVYNRLEEGGGYVKDSAVEGIVVQINPEMGAFIAVDNRFFGMIPVREIHDRISLGDRLFGRVSSVRDDGKYMISITQKSYIQMGSDAERILKELDKAGGSLPFGDKSDASEIKKQFSMSKNAFKKALGHLYKEGKINIESEKTIKILQKCDKTM